MAKRPSQGELTAMTKAVGAYLDYVHRPKNRGPQRYSPARLEKLKNELKKEDVSWVKKLELTAKVRQLEEYVSDEDPTEEFIRVARAWAEVKGVDYYDFRELGVPAKVLKEAGWR